MTTWVIIGIVLLSLAGVLILGIIFFSFLKYLKREYFPKWKFPDYISVGYAEYLYHKFIKRDLKQ
jgi:hypothetical protein